MRNPNIFVERAEMIRAHPDCPEKPRIIQSLLAELEERTDIPKEVKARVRAILAA
jgi:hypothetical protein